MKKEEFKKMIKESVREVLLTEGILSTIISEVMKGVGNGVVVESAPPLNDVRVDDTDSRTKKFKQMKQEEKTKKREMLLDPLLQVHR